jgi:hypothetical protein
VEAFVDDRRVRWESRAKPVAGGLRQDHLAAIRRGRDPGGVVDVDPDIPGRVAGRLGDRRMEAHTQGQGPARPARQVPHAAADQDSRLHCGKRVVERRERAVTLVLDDHAASIRDRSIDQGVVLEQQAGPGVGPKVASESGASLDVGEQERDGRWERRQVPTALRGGPGGGAPVLRSLRSTLPTSVNVISGERDRSRVSCVRTTSPGGRSQVRAAMFTVRPK